MAQDEVIFPGCGEFCNSCVYYTGEKEPKCPGCSSENGEPFWGECSVFKCMADRNVEHCGLCGEFPCDLFINHYEETLPEGQRVAVLKAGVLAYRARHGDEKTIELLRKINFQSGK
jgi:hypothetical protein